MFTEAEANFLIKCIDEEVKRTGLQSAQMSLSIIGKIQQSFQTADKEKDEPKAP